MTHSNKKVGKKSWKPAKMLDVLDKVAGYRYRWCDKDPASLDKKQAEEWQFVKGRTAKLDASTDAAKDIEGADKSLTSITEYRELVLMRLDEETAEARDEYYNNLNNKQAAVSPKERVKSMAQSANMRVPPLQTID